MEDLEALAVGAGILGSGGGGDPKYDLLMAKYLIQRYGPVSIIKADELNDDDLVVPIAFVGAPLIAKEKLPSGREFAKILQSVKKHFGNKKIVLMPGEIGGANAFAAIIAAAILNLPVLDADTIGRAFPQLQMSSCNLKGISASPAFISDSKKNMVVISANDCETVESLARNIAVNMGSSACISLYIMKGSRAKSAVVKDSLSKAIKIGRSVNNAFAGGEDPVKALLKTIKGQCVFQGTVIDVDQKIKNGFLQGTASVFNNKKHCHVLYQNENLIAKIEDKIIVSTPDIITVVEASTGKPITCDCLSYGQRVCVIAIPSLPIWITKKGLKMVGPKAFGFNVDYKPLKKRA